MKRAFDVAGATFVGLLLSPFIAVIAVLVAVNLGSPVFFRQLRPGRYGLPFTMIKFRTMRDAIDVEGNPQPDAERLTRFGRLLRSSSLDELPELWNVLRGDMSLVGPRPLLMEYQSLLLDIRILCMTLLKVLKREGVSGIGEVTMARFEGNK